MVSHPARPEVAFDFEGFNINHSKLTKRKDLSNKVSLCNESHLALVSRYILMVDLSDIISQGLLQTDLFDNEDFLSEIIVYVMLKMPLSQASVSCDFKRLHLDMKYINNNVLEEVIFLNV